MTYRYTEEEKRWIYYDNGPKFKEGCPDHIRESVEKKRKLASDIARHDYERLMKR